MLQNVIFHIPYKIDTTKPSASQIRPAKMIQAFKDSGFEVDVIMGDSKERKVQIDNIKRKIKKGNKYLYLYSESSTMPTLLTDSHHLPLNPFLDFSFFAFCKKNEIPIGLFYRDLHWRFPFYNKHASFLKKGIAKMFYKYDLFKYKSLLKVLFLPSLEMSKYIPELNKLKIKELPPGLTVPINIIEPSLEKVKRNVLYVGGLSSDIYNILLFTKTIREFKNFQFTICCRKYDYESLSENEKFILTSSENVTIVHKSGEELKTLFRETDICCLFIKPIKYWEFAMPAKLFEYISYLKPIIAVENTKSGRFIKENNLGWTIPFDQTELKKILMMIDEDFEAITNTFKGNLLEAQLENTWESRVKLITQTLTRS